MGLPKAHHSPSSTHVCHSQGKTHLVIILPQLLNQVQHGLKILQVLFATTLSQPTTKAIEFE